MNDNETIIATNSSSSLELDSTPASAGGKNAEVLDIQSLRLGQDFAELAGVKKLLTTVPVRKPGRQVFVRVHPDPDYRLQTAVLELKEESEHYLVDRHLWGELAGEIVPKVMLTSITRQGVLFVWPIRLPGEDGRLDQYNRSAMEAVSLAEKSWIRLAANRSLGAYEVCQATGELPEPEWPDVSFEEILKIAFRDRWIRSLDHPVMAQLRGES